MKIIEFCQTTEDAHALRGRLLQAGINGRVVVDPLATRYPILAAYDAIAIEVPELQVKDAIAALKGHVRRAS